MLRILVRVYTAYAGFFEEVGALHDFERLVEKVEALQGEDGFVEKLMRIGEAYETLEQLCRRRRKDIPPTVLNSLRADITDIIEATPLT